MYLTTKVWTGVDKSRLKHNCQFPPLFDVTVTLKCRSVNKHCYHPKFESTIMFTELQYPLKLCVCKLTLLITQSQFFKQVKKFFLLKHENFISSARPCYAWDKQISHNACVDTIISRKKGMAKALHLDQAAETWELLKVNFSCYPEASKKIQI